MSSRRPTQRHTAIHAVNGCDATTMERNLYQIKQAQKRSAVTSSGRLVDSMEELFLDTLTSTGRRQNSHPITTWHTPRAFQYPCSVNDIMEVKVPLDCAVLTADWMERYQADHRFCPYWDRLVWESVLGIKGIEYVLHQGRVRAQSKICVPLGIMAKVCKASFAFV